VATVGVRGKRNFYIITHEALTKLYNQHQQDLLNCGIRNQVLFEVALTITAANASNIYGAANPNFSGTVTAQQNGDTFTESFATTATVTP
jgi:hypothetical protein